MALAISLMGLDDVVDAYVRHVKLDTHNIELPMFPMTKTPDYMFCYVKDCWFKVTTIVTFADVSDRDLGLCEHHHKHILNRIISKWSYVELQQRIIFTCTFSLCRDISIDHIDDCYRCGLHTICLHWVRNTKVPICNNCYEYSIGGKCKLAIMVLHRTSIIIADIKHHIVSLLHRLFMPSYQLI